MIAVPAGDDAVVHHNNPTLQADTDDKGRQRELENSRRAVEFIRSREGASQPFFLSAGFGPPKGTEAIGCAPGLEPTDPRFIRPPMHYPDTAQNWNPRLQQDPTLRQWGEPILTND